MSTPLPPTARRWRTWANLLTGLRLAMAPVLALAWIEGHATTAAALFALAVATDLADGRVARRLGEASPLGGLLDHWTDATFVTLGLAALAHSGLVTPWLPPLIVAAFAQYVLDSRAMQGRPLRTSRLGRWNGIAYYVLLGIPVVRDGLEVGWPPDALVAVLGFALLATTLVSMAERLRALLHQAGSEPG